MRKNLRYLAKVSRQLGIRNRNVPGFLYGQRLSTLKIIWKIILNFYYKLFSCMRNFNCMLKHDNGRNLSSNQFDLKIYLFKLRAQTKLIKNFILS